MYVFQAGGLQLISFWRNDTEIWNYHGICYWTSRYWWECL